MEDLQPECNYYDCTAFNKMYKKSKRQFSAVHMNTRSLKNKVDTVEALLHSVNAKFDAIIFTETWLTSSDSPPKFHSYKCESLVRQEKRGGGVAIYIKDNLRYQIIDEFTRIDENIESLVIKISNTVVVALYRPPSGNIAEFTNTLDNILCVLGSTSAPLVILGDINIDTISDNSQAKEFRDLLNEHACNNVISLPTRVTLNTATSLDVCITNLNKNDVIAGVLVQDISDHLPIFLLGIYS